MERLDKYLFEKGFAPTRSKAQEIIKNGLVQVEGETIYKNSYDVAETAHVCVKEHEEFVSRGAYKLLEAIEKFNISLSDLVVLDVGASTGGFTQVALQKGATRVYAVDVGKGQLDKSLAAKERVISMEGRDIRSLTEDDVKDVDFVVGDISFISLSKVLPHLNMILGRKRMVFLFKPQFECGAKLAKKFKGVIKDKSVHVKLLEEFCEQLKTIDFSLCDLIASPIRGGDGNREYLIYLNAKEQKKINIAKVVNSAFDK